MWDRTKKRGRMFHRNPHRTNGVPETGILARAEAAVQGILQILDSACQAKNRQRGWEKWWGKTHRFSIGSWLWDDPYAIDDDWPSKEKTTEGWEYGDHPGRP